jgi:BMFP domain-containing protein YqiC
MKHKNTLKEVPLRREKILQAWQSYAQKDVFAEMTREEFAAATEASLSKRQELETLLVQMQGLIQERELADATTRELINRVVIAVRGDSRHGMDSAMYRAMGYVTRSERASGLKRKAGKKPKG